MGSEKDESDVIPDVSQSLGNGNPREGCLISKAIVKVLQVHQKESQSIYQKKAKLYEQQVKAPLYNKYFD